MVASSELGGVQVAGPPRAQRWSRGIGRALREPALSVSALVLLAVTLAAVLAPAIAPFSPNEQHLGDALVGPNSTYWLGTDQSGRDILSRTMFAGRVSLLVAFGSMVVGTGLATLLGGVSGFFGGWFDSIMQRLVDASLSIPALILLMTVLTIIGPSILKMTIVIGGWAMISSSRTVRSAVLAVKERPFVEAARTVGAGDPRIFALHILPNIVAPVIVIASLIFGYAILIEATLSFLGFGVPPPTATWGGMLSGDTRTYLITAPWIAIAPGVALTAVVIAVNLLGDSLRDVLDPRLKGNR